MTRWRATSTSTDRTAPGVASSLVGSRQPSPEAGIATAVGVRTAVSQPRSAVVPARTSATLPTARTSARAVRRLPRESTERGTRAAIRPSAPGPAKPPSYRVPDDASEESGRSRCRPRPVRGPVDRDGDRAGRDPGDGAEVPGGGRAAGVRRAGEAGHRRGGTCSDARSTHPGGRRPGGWRRSRPSRARRPGWTYRPKARPWSSSARSRRCTSSKRWRSDCRRRRAPKGGARRRAAHRRASSRRRSVTSSATTGARRAWPC